jgi:hypothetical protein
MLLGLLALGDAVGHRNGGKRVHRGDSALLNGRRLLLIKSMLVEFGQRGHRLSTATIHMLRAHSCWMIRELVVFLANGYFALVGVPAPCVYRTPTSRQ